jgi:serine phosphatase RsbU (regulator of sigma subunit)
MVAVLWAHIVALPVLACLLGAAWWQGLADAAPVAALTAVAYLPIRRRLGSAAATLGLLACSASLIHITGGLAEAHFHVFVVIALISLYEDWWAYGIAFAFAAVHHAVLGSVRTQEIFYHPGRFEAVPAWEWTLIHAAFVAAAAAVGVVSWRLNERYRLASGDQAARAAHAEAVAGTLRQSLMPAHLPQVPGVRLAQRYLPGDGQIGGDWFEVVDLQDDRVMVAMGDVAGHGIPAAALTARLRYTFTAYAAQGRSADWILGRLDTLCQGMMATVCIVEIHPDQHTLAYRRAGHPPPMLRRRDGTVEVLDGALSPPLAGLGVDQPPSQAVNLAWGDMLLLYTDGLVERRGEPLDIGLRRLASALAAGSGDPQRICADLPGVLLEGQRVDDDVALLCVQADRRSTVRASAPPLS